MCIPIFSSTRRIPKHVLTIVESLNPGSFLLEFARKSFVDLPMDLLYEHIFQYVVPSSLFEIFFVRQKVRFSSWELKDFYVSVK